MDALDELIGESAAITALKDTVRRLLEGRSGQTRLPTVLIEGETGTGKGLLARAIHRGSVRSGGPFVEVNCAAIPESLLEAELFGYERGAFTDAREAKPGLFEAAERGTLFLDEIGLLPEGAQAKLLKAIEEKVVRRLGSTRSRPVDVWMLGATNRGLEAAMREGRFREDLYHRLAVVTLQVPPLRERGGDVGRLAAHFLERACAEYGVDAKALTPGAVAVLEAHRWPGNVRELANAMERVAILTDGGRVTPEMLDLADWSTGEAEAEAREIEGDGPGSLRETLDAVERERLLRALDESDWNISQAAAQLGLPRGTLRYRMARHGLAPAPPSPGSRPRESPLTPARPVKATNLPRQLTSFIGREGEMTRVKAALEASPLVTLTGAGGVGKTRLALQMALDLLPGLPDGAWLVDLAPLSDSERVPHAVAAALGIREHPGRAVADVLLEFLRSKALLLLLDNCEHLLGAAAALADQLLRECPRLRILATSREGFGVSGETLQVIAPLAVPPSEATLSLDQVLRFEAVRLFASRAIDLSPGFTVTERNAGAVAEICRRLDGIPLALELAAGRIRAMTVEEIAGRLDDRFRLLTGGSRTALPRHQTLRGVLDWSHQLLSDAERVLLRRLSVFAGGFTLDAAEHVCVGQGLEAGEMLDLLIQLVGRSLAVFEDTERRTGYRLLETIRQYAQERLLEAGETDQVRAAHLAYFRALAEQSEDALHGPTQREWLDRLDAEPDNLEAALQWSLEPPQRPERVEAGARLAGSVWWYWLMRDQLTYGRQWLETLLAAGSGISPAARAKCLMGLGAYAWRLDDYRQAWEALDEGLTLGRQLGDGRLAGYALHFRAHVQEAWGQVEQAVSTHEESLAAFQALGGWELAKSYYCLGNALRKQGDLARAKPMLEKSLEIFRDFGEVWGLSHTLRGLGVVARSEGDRARALALFEESLLVSHETGDTSGTAAAQLLLGNMARREGQYGRATSLYRESLATVKTIGDRQGAAMCLAALSRVALAQGRAARAARLLGAAERLLEVIGWTFPPGERAGHDRAVAALRAALGGEEYERTAGLGALMTLDRAVAYAMCDET
jgi:non-specific serine/threonine protein kinase